VTKNPFVNALGASGYIFLVVGVMTLLMSRSPKEDGFLAPVLGISMFTLSAAVMGYIFGAQPLTLFISGKKKEAINLFLKTVLIFAVCTLVIIILVLSGQFV